MISSKTKRLISRYLNKQATLAERNELELWLEKDENYNLFKDYVKINYLINLSMDMFDADDSKKQLLEFINKEKKQYKISKYMRYFKYAAIVVLFLGLGYAYQNGYFSSTKNVVIPANSITLQLDNGNIEVLDENGTSKILNNQGKVIGSQKGKQLIYDKDADIDGLVYSTLTVPFGKRFYITLSDGTGVNLNAGTSLRYPVKFIKGEQRQVFLTGEAFFDVAKDKEHPFIVNAEQLNVQVLGTAFNVSAYPEDKITDVVLVEGKVSLYPEEQTMQEGATIKPGEKGTLDKNSDKISTEFVDVSIYTSWINGDLVFRDMTFESIIKKLERHFNMKIILTNEKLKHEIFNATFKEEPTIEKILDAFGKSYGVEYNIKDNAIFVK